MKTIYHIINIAVAFICSVFIGMGQSNDNLISNGSFESVNKEPKKLGNIENALGWYSPTGSRADLFVETKKTPIIATPSNQFGTENPKEGSNYAGIVTFSHNNKVPRSYISTKLELPLKKGEQYCVQFYISLAEASAYASNQVAAHFSQKAFASEAKDNLIAKTSIVDAENRIFAAVFGWDKICGIYTAEGGEKYITIGNFTSNEHTKNAKVKKDSKNKITPIPAAYYYIDDISVVRLEEDEICDCSSTIIDPMDAFSKIVYQKAINFTNEMGLAEKIEALQVFFGFGKTDLTHSATEVLDTIAKIMKEAPLYDLVISAYSDKLEDEMSNEYPILQDMDKKRAKEIVDYLKTKGVQANRLKMETLGSKHVSAEVVDSDEDEIKQAKNRRVEFKVETR